MSPIVTPDTCSACVFWTRIDDEKGTCRRYAPAPVTRTPKTKEVEMPVTRQYSPACGDYKKI